MIIIGPDSRNERLEVMLWRAATGPQTQAVRRFLLRRRLTLAAALITRSRFGADEAVRRN